jgi:hypothetical protein
MNSLGYAMQQESTWHGALFPTGYSGIHAMRVGQTRTDEKGAMQVVSPSSRSSVGLLGKENL